MLRAGRRRVRAEAPSTARNRNRLAPTADEIGTAVTPISRRPVAKPLGVPDQAEGPSSPGKTMPIFVGVAMVDGTPEGIGEGEHQVVQACAPYIWESQQTKVLRVASAPQLQLL